ncbi:MAG: DUF262 domain-containing protein [Anaerolineae bacterium]|nr:DUF262 domain-containing protein [Anaerolineae bacterium]
MHTGTLNIKAIFGQDRRLVVPLYQRPYVWDREKQWEPLWEDVCAIADRLLTDQPVRPHFMGAIVLDQMPQPTGHLENRLIIDGQQRLTTIQILLEAFADICDATGAERYHKALLKLTRNDDPLSDDPDDEYKVWPTNVDQSQFRRVMQAGSPDQLDLRQFQRPHLIADSYIFFHEAVLAWVKPDLLDHERRIEVLYSALRESVRMVVIDLENEDDAQLIFETLNARGTPLLPSDLVKNYLLRQAGLEGEPLEPLYRQYWQPFDQRAEYWRRELGPGHAKRARIDLYLQHYLTLKTRDVVPVAHLYSSFREHAKNGDKAKTHLQSVDHYAQIYQRFDALDIHTRVGRFFRRLEQMNTTTTYPFLLELFDLYDVRAPQLGEVLVDIESLLVRRMVCQLPTRAYNRLFIDLLKTLDGPREGIATRVRDALLQSDAESSRWPKDSEFRQAWLNTPLFRRLRRERVRMLLEALELALFTELTEKLEIKSGLTIEHLMPRHWYAYWPLPSDIPPKDAEERRETLLHTIGNLTLLTKRLNPKVSNGPWDEKQPVILEHSALTLNRQLQHYAQWDEEAIAQRGEALFEVARGIWPYPGS